MNLEEIQIFIQQSHLDGWLLYDFHHRDPIAYRILGLPEDQFTSRRWFYFIPSKGIPHKIVSVVEDRVLDSLPGEKHLFLSWKNLHQVLKDILASSSVIAMNYSPMGEVPYVSLVDAGTIEMIKSFGKEVKSAQDLIQRFEGIITDEQYQSHLTLSPIMHQITKLAFDHIGKQIALKKRVTELDIVKFMQAHYNEHHLITVGSPEVAINKHAADPHYNPESDNAEIKPGDLVLIDSWAKLDSPNAVYYDFTQMAYVGTEIPENIQKVWDVVKTARDKAIEFEKNKILNSKPCYGWEIDEVARDYIIQQGYGKYFRHRLGHSIGREVHGNAVHLDSLETKDTREIVPGVLHSVEPGVYIPEENLGIRTEVDVYISPKRNVIVTGPIQSEIYRINLSEIN